MLKDNISKVKERIASVCLKINRDPSQISIVAVSKGRPVEDIIEAVACGITDIGENRVQEAILKYNKLVTGKETNRQIVRWHMVGHLQTNKVKEAVKIFDLIQSVDSLYLAEEIDKQAAKINKIQDILIEIKTSPEVTKFGLNADAALGVIKEVGKFKNIYIKGLMTIAPPVKHPEEARPYFKILSGLLDDLNRQTILSMGMSDDFEVAIEEGAGMLRIGRAIFN
ncbi:MAG: YggS family pyridoxal phosphate-dependent enzyme [Candidatus Omnitrophica bacterium]|nr:YggS family pyridoxal phosphate-dependent enzyme [Candidatus Omnitrophota bacterium]